MILYQIFALFLAYSIVEAGGGKKGDKKKGKHTYTSYNLDSIYEITQVNYTTLAAAFQAAGLASVYDCSGRCPQITLFAPTNEAFAALDPFLLNTLTTEAMYQEHLAQLLEYHTVKGKIESFAINNGDAFRTLQGGTLSFSVTLSAIQLNAQATVIKTDTEASNGFIHDIDSVLIPAFVTTNLVDTLRNNSDLSILVTAIETAGLVDTLNSGNFTLFAPDNNAFSYLTVSLEELLADTVTLNDILAYHLIPNRIISKYNIHNGYLTTLQGQDIEVDSYHNRVYLNEETRISDFNNLASMAIYHTTDRVLMPPAPLTDMAATAAAQESLTTLSSALVAASLVDDLQAPAPFTCFFPTDEAFAKLGTTVVSSLFADVTVLTSILLYHCVHGEIRRADLTDTQLTTLQGSALELDYKKKNRFRVNDADIVEYDIRATNGVVHLIDEVLEIPPPLPTISDVLANDGDFDTLYAAIKTVGMEAMLDAPGNFTLFAPNDRAFDRYGPSNVQALISDSAALTKFLEYHLLPERLYSSALRDGIVKSSNGINIRVDVDNKGSHKGRKTRLNGWVKIKEFDITCSNGVIHVLQDVLPVPANIYASLEGLGLTMLSDALTSITELQELLESPDSDYTMFAPTNQAFVALGATDPTELLPILQYHLVPGSLLASDLIAGTSLSTLQGGMLEINAGKKRYWIRVNSAWVVDVNNLASNGVIHIINEVLVPANEMSSSS